MSANIIFVCLHIFEMSIFWRGEFLRSLGVEDFGVDRDFEVRRCVTIHLAIKIPFKSHRILLLGEMEGSSSVV